MGGFWDTVEHGLLMLAWFATSAAIFAVLWRWLVPTMSGGRLPEITFPQSCGVLVMLRLATYRTGTRREKD
jgi:hypothetical protein